MALPRMTSSHGDTLRPNNSIQSIDSMRHPVTLPRSQGRNEQPSSAAQRNGPLRPNAEKFPVGRAGTRPRPERFLRNNENSIKAAQMVNRWFLM